MELRPSMYGHLASRLDSAVRLPDGIQFAMAGKKFVDGTKWELKLLPLSGIEVECDKSLASCNALMVVDPPRVDKNPLVAVARHDLHIAAVDWWVALRVEQPGEQVVRHATVLRPLLVGEIRQLPYADHVLLGVRRRVEDPVLPRSNPAQEVVGVAVGRRVDPVPCVFGHVVDDDLVQLAADVEDSFRESRDRFLPGVHAILVRRFCCPGACSRVENLRDGVIVADEEIVSVRPHGSVHVHTTEWTKLVSLFDRGRERECVAGVEVEDAPLPAVLAPVYIPDRDPRHRPELVAVREARPRPARGARIACQQPAHLVIRALRVQDEVRLGKQEILDRRGIRGCVGRATR